jgi:hypothetical protein
MQYDQHQAEAFSAKWAEFRGSHRGAGVVVVQKGMQFIGLGEWPLRKNPSFGATSSSQHLL